VGGLYEKMFVPKNSVSGTMQSINFMTGLNHIKDVIAEARAAGKKLRAFGSTFVINNLRYTKGLPAGFKRTQLLPDWI